ncbi:uncharacterized protein LOC114187530 isoform X3 [Vigna unguiculata]|uniref:uncharacterized protein LOC114187530 isoform X3 n=1 Tax=Vigna unguiculata TaxID=3917 RepID=UPI0010164062|nr:uncharacterized protein LOC114187530 isoform X3 [Vigna unguiculata]
MENRFSLLCNRFSGGAFLWRSRRGGGAELVRWLVVVVCCCRWWSAPVCSCRCFGDRGGSPSLCLGLDLQETENWKSKKRKSFGH